MYFQHQKTPEDTPSSDTITNSGFWPDIVMSDFIENRRIPTDYNDSANRDALIKAMRIINIELMNWKEKQQGNGITDANDAGEVIDGKGSAAGLYISAVYDRAKATLLAHYETLNRREEADNLAKESKETSDRYLAESQFAVRAILGINTSSVKLI